MVVVKKRRKRVFDKECTSVYAELLRYESLDDARAHVPDIAKALRLKPKAVGGYLTQASSNPRVTEHLLRLGYTEDQVPEWFQCPENPPAPPVENPRIVEAQPMTRAPSPMLKGEKLNTGHVPNATENESEHAEKKEPWLKDIGWILPEIDMNKLPPGYTIRTIWCDGQAEPEKRPEQEKKEPKPRSSEGKPAEPEGPNIDWPQVARACVWMECQRSLERAVAEERKNCELEEFKQSVIDSVKSIASVKPDTSKQVAPPSPFQMPKSSPPMSLVGIDEFIEEGKRAQREDRKALSRFYVENQKEKRSHLKEKLAKIDQGFAAWWEEHGPR